MATSERYVEDIPGFIRILAESQFRALKSLIFHNSMKPHRITQIHGLLLFRNTRNSSWLKAVLTEHLHVFFFPPYPHKACFTWPKSPDQAATPLCGATSPCDHPAPGWLCLATYMAINPLKELKRCAGQKSCQIWGLTSGNLEELFYGCSLDLSKWILVISIGLGALQWNQVVWPHACLSLPCPTVVLHPCPLPVWNNPSWSCGAILLSSALSVTKFFHL